MTVPGTTSKRWAYGLLASSVLALVVAGLLELRADRRHDLERIVQQTGGDPARGAEVIARAGCGACHEIGGVPGARGLVGPPLNNMSGRVYVAGRLTNTPEHLTQWIRNPQSVDPLTAMPSVGLTDAEARDVVAFLYAHN
jgi:cytochrome c